VTFFNETVNGLDVGADVKFRGVRVGRVTDITIAVLQDKAPERASLIPVFFEIDKEKLYKRLQGNLHLDERGLEELVNDGLRTRLGQISFITGVLYVELDFNSSPEREVPTLPTNGHTEIPALESPLSGLEETANNILRQIESIEFERISNETVGLLTDLRRNLDSLDLATTTATLQETLESINRILNSPRVESILVNTESALMHIGQLAERLDSLSEPMSEDLAATIEHAHETMEEFRNLAMNLNAMVRPYSGFRSSIEDMVSQIAQLSRQLSALAAEIERNPQSLLYGKPDS